MKRIILCLDSSAEDVPAGSTPTNVAKLHHAIASTDSNGVRQVPHYIACGTAEPIRTAYALLAADYEAGDEIYCFGASYSAFQARGLAEFIELFGVAKSIEAFAFDEAWSLYRAAAKKSLAEASLVELRTAAHYPARIRCLGVWDTVNLPSSGGRAFKLRDTRPRDAIDIGLHALSIDETRGRLRPVLWTMPAGEILSQRRHIEQVWFAGSHGDVVGGLREGTLSDVTLLWMAERVAATTELALDMDALKASTRSDPLGPQHAPTAGLALRLARAFPFIRLVKQAIAGIPPLRRMLFGGLRTSKVQHRHMTINESIHESVLLRFGEKVIELRSGRSHMIVYQPRMLSEVIPKEYEPVARPASHKLQRIKVFTVHGTFAHDTSWDSWDPNNEQRFVSRLRQHLRERGVTLDELDHTQYKWSGGNSHDERRTAAIGLKKLIEAKLRETYAQHGKDYYDAVYIVGHSHGGTISRLAMNLWEKPHDYYDPTLDAHFDEFKHDDQCQSCRRPYNGKVGPNTVPRPTGVITLGSPFVTFEKRKAGLVAAHIGAWAFRALSLVPVAALYIAYKYDELVSFLAMFMLPGWLGQAIQLALPIGLYWLIASYLPQLLLGPVERRFGKGGALAAVSSALQVLKFAFVAGLCVYYLAYWFGGWALAAQWLPFLRSETVLSWVRWSVPLIAFWLLAVTLPRWFLTRMHRKVLALQEKLPKKYDPSEGRPVPYLSYLTFGDEAGIHLKIFGFITWLIQASALAAVCALAFGIILTGVVVVETFVYLLEGNSILSRFGVSALSSDRAVQDRFIALMDCLTFLPSAWSNLFGQTQQYDLGALENRHDVVRYIPGALVAMTFLTVLIFVPIQLVLYTIAYAINLSLRGSGLVFGSEKLAWTLANRISISPHANSNSMLRRIFIAPEAWRRRELAHAYYYQSDRVIADVANYMADWTRHTPSRPWPTGWIASSGTGLVVALSMLSIFSNSVSMAKGFEATSRSFFGGNGTDRPATPPQPEAQPAPPEPEPEPEPPLVESGDTICRGRDVTVDVQVEKEPEITYEARLEAAARDPWTSAVTAKYGPLWASFELAKERSPWACSSADCKYSGVPCARLMLPPATIAPDRGATPAPESTDGTRQR